MGLTSALPCRADAHAARHPRLDRRHRGGRARCPHRRPGRARRLRRQRELRDLAALSWQQFEEVIADAFRRHGYRVREVGGRGRADGGVDLVLTREGQTTVVQAKHWRSDRVGVQLVRELYGVQRATPGASRDVRYA